MPETLIAEGPAGPVAYQVLGDGARTLIADWGFISHVEAFHDMPGYTTFLERLSESHRVVTFDHGGMGASPGRVATFDERVRTISFLADEVAGGTISLLGTSSGGAVAAAFAARHSGRTDALILFGAYPCFRATSEIPMVTPELEKGLRSGLPSVGRGLLTSSVAPSMAAGRETRRTWVGIEASAMTPASAEEHLEVEVSIDVTADLPSIQARTLVMHRVNEQFVPPQVAAYFARSIPDAELLYLDGFDHFPWLGRSDVVAGAMTSFLDGRLDRPPPLTTVVLTDIVGSTEQLVALGEARWAELIGEHDRVVERQVDLAEGELVKTTGDGMVALFHNMDDALRCAVAIRDRLSALGLEIRTGVTIGDVGRVGNDVTGICVNTAERIAGLAGPGQIFLSRGASLFLPEARPSFIGLRQLKGVPGHRSVFELR